LFGIQGQLYELDPRKRNVSVLTVSASGCFPQQSAENGPELKDYTFSRNFMLHRGHFILDHRPSFPIKVWHQAKEQSNTVSIGWCHVSLVIVFGCELGSDKPDSFKYSMSMSWIMTVGQAQRVTQG
jgi:hypothetical protein